MVINTTIVVPVSVHSPLNLYVILSGTFTNNVATSNGGAIATINNLHKGGLFLGNVSATGNRADMGGAVYGTDQATITIGNGTALDRNMASSNGGAVACVECASLTLLGVSMTSNQAASSGGALYAEASTAIQSQDVQYTGNWYVSLLSSGILWATHAISSPTND